MQFRRDRQNAHRIACYQAWEEQLTDYLFKGGYEKGGFGLVPWPDRWLFRDFLGRYQSSLAGQESEILRELYLGLGIHSSLPQRLRHRNSKVRAQAAKEIAVFRLDEPAEHAPPPVVERPWRWKPGVRLEGYLDQVLPLLNDPVPFVAHMAALTLTRSRSLRFAAPVLAWVMREDRYQRERLLRVLEGFGPTLLPWMKENLESPDQNPEPWILFALLVGSHRHRESQARVLWLLDVPNVDLRASALKALIILADPTVYPKVLPFASNPAWAIRAQVARALGVLGGPDAVPNLLPLMADPVFEVRRNAAQSLVDLGHAGVSALTWLADDPSADRFARDMALERLEWANERGHL
ncbi:MAG TPA: HEAT repeat domain-containing protein [Geothrix sp.]